MWLTQSPEENKANEVIMTDKDGIDVDDVNTTPPRTPEREQKVTFKEYDNNNTPSQKGKESPKQTQIVVTKPMDKLSPYQQSTDSVSPSKSVSLNEKNATQHNIITSNNSSQNSQNDVPNVIILGNIGEEDEQPLNGEPLKVPDVTTTPVKNKQVNFSQSPKQKGLSGRSRLNKHRHSNSLNIDHLMKVGDQPPRSPSPDPVADEDAFNLFMGAMNGGNQSYDEDEENVAETAKMLNNKSHTHSSGAISLEVDSDDEEPQNSMDNSKDNKKQTESKSSKLARKSSKSRDKSLNKSNKTNGPSFRKLPQTEDEAEDNKDDIEEDDDTVIEGESMDAPQPLYDRAPDSFRFDMIETAEEAEVILVGIMRTLWFDRVQKHITKAGLEKSIDDLFFILSNVWYDLLLSIFDSFHYYFFFFF